jgi:Xaa-Pro aminopeptidase
LVPDAGGLLVFSRLNIYYLTGTMGAGVVWLPYQGDPVLLCRRGEGRARLESPLDKIISFRSFGELPRLLDTAGSPLASTVAAEMNGLSWSLSSLLLRHLPDCSFLSGDRILALARSVKSPWEMEKLALAGSRHATSLLSLLPPFLSPGMTEAAVAHRLWEVLFGQGHQGILRMDAFGEEVFLGHVSAGVSANYPSVMNGPVGLRGQHPAAPFMGSASTVWHDGEPLTVDVGFSLEGYQTDKTQVYWAGRRQSIPRQVRAAHEFCVRVQQMVAENLKPGSLPSALAAQAFAMAAQEGWSDGFMALGGNKVPFIGHGIGLSIDEYPVFAEGFDEPLLESMAVAIEPKIGLPGIGMVGLENTFEVTPAGGRCLTGHDYDIVCVAPSASAGVQG